MVQLTCSLIVRRYGVRRVSWFFFYKIQSSCSMFRILERWKLFVCYKREVSSLERERMIRCLVSEDTFVLWRGTRHYNKISSRSGHKWWKCNLFWSKKRFLINLEDVSFNLRLHKSKLLLADNSFVNVRSLPEGCCSPYS